MSTTMENNVASLSSMSIRNDTATTRPCNSNNNHHDTLAVRRTLCDKLYELCMKPTDLFKFETTFMEIWEILEKLNQLESSIPFCCRADGERNESKFEAFIEYLESHKCSVRQAITIEKLNDFNNYGVKAIKSFEHGSILFEVPRDLCISINDALDSKLNELILHDKLLYIMPHVSLALYLLYLKVCNNESTQDSDSAKWKFYLDILPHTFNTPLYFNLNELKSLQPAQCFTDIIIHIRNIARQYAYLFKLLDSQSNYEILKKNFSFQNYKWCVSVVSTRQNQIVDEKKNKILAMIPLLDMCNHEDGEMCTDYDDSSKCARVLANKSLKAGDHINIFYGVRNNRDMLIHNGFVCETNKNNSVIIKLGVSVSDPLFDDRCFVLEQFGLNPTESFEIKQTHADKVNIIPSELYFFVRIFLMKTTQELEEVLKFKSKNIEKYVKKNELRSTKSKNGGAEIAQFLRMRFTILLKSYAKSQSNESTIPNEPKSLFIRRLLTSEADLIKKALDSLADV